MKMTLQLSLPFHLLRPATASALTSWLRHLCTSRQWYKKDANESKNDAIEPKNDAIEPKNGAIEPKNDASEPKDQWVEGLEKLKERFQEIHHRDVAFPYYADICVIGGGAVGASVAYWLKQRNEKLNVVVLERDPSYSYASSTLSVGGIRQQFSLPENIQLSQFGINFLRTMGRNLQVEGRDPPNPSFSPHGYMFAATEEGMDQLVKNIHLQRKYGAKVELLTANDLKQQFPWMNVEGLAGASHGLEGEGSFDPWAVIYALKRKTISLGGHYIHGEAVGFAFDKTLEGEFFGHIGSQFNRIDKVLVKMDSGEMRFVKAAYYVVAAGAFAKNIAEMAGIGKGEGLLRHVLPIEPRKRYVFVFHCPDGPGFDCPMFIDPSGVYFRREGLAGVYLSGRSPPSPDLEPPISNLDVDYSFFDNHIWPILAHRVPAFQALKLRSAWAGYYDTCYFDENAIIGPHPYHSNMYFAAGFSGHGIQQSMGVGRVVSEMIIDGKCVTIDLGRFGFSRIMLNKPLLEENIV
ncbi:unnamed protein product [Darwinula stevensoni]|uniref:FAD-dependent oxidoreductase domain-containing protein 1 n=1 Tax=Darwinula stevensoni TaxID=69355 RepID=A0A7R8XE51_9CRUS|nr:unnamed protein product [Darwinula stevensoni]CAG0887451.1 unnamed protein product [Darwinula stevensoni]